MFSEQHPGKDLQFCGDICQTVTHSCKLHAQVTHISKSQLLFQPWSLRLLQNYFLKCSSDVKLFYPEIVQHTADLQLKCTETEKMRAWSKCCKLQVTAWREIEWETERYGKEERSVVSTTTFPRILSYLYIAWHAQSLMFTVSIIMFF